MLRAGTNFLKDVTVMRRDSATFLTGVTVMRRDSATFLKGVTVSRRAGTVFPKVLLSRILAEACKRKTQPSALCHPAPLRERTKEKGGKCLLISIYLPRNY